MKQASQKNQSGNGRMEQQEQNGGEVVTKELVAHRSHEDFGRDGQQPTQENTVKLNQENALASQVAQQGLETLRARLAEARAISLQKLSITEAFATRGDVWRARSRRSLPAPSRWIGARQPERRPWDGSRVSLRHLLRQRERERAPIREAHEALNREAIFQLEFLSDYRIDVKWTSAKGTVQGGVSVGYMAHQHSFTC